MVVEAEIILKLVLAAVLGSAIGLERKVHNKSAGMRTHALVCVGAALFAIMSTIGLSDPTDYARISAGLVTGIGFLGAGMIFKSEKRVEGLTTAAEIWALGAIGLTIGFGFYIVALVASVIVIVVLWPEGYIESVVTGKRQTRNTRKDN